MWRHVSEIPVKSGIKFQNKKTKKILTKEDKIKELENKILYLEAENEYLKKLNALVQEEELVKNKESE